MSGQTIGPWPKRLVGFLRSEDGPTAVEYAFMLALIVLVAAAAISQCGGMMEICYENIRDAMAVVGL